MITSQQIRKIHILKNLLCMSEETYRKHLQSFEVGSSKNLTEAEAALLISNFEEKVRLLNLKKYDGFVSRDDDLATPLQLRKMESVWSEICQLRTDNHSHKTLKDYLSQHFHINNIHSLTKERAGKIIGIMEKKIIKSLLKAV